MFKKLFLTTCLVTGLLLLGCPPPKPTTENLDCSPSNIQVDVNDKAMNISWVDNCNKTISGYNIYLSEQPQSTEPYNGIPFEGDTDPSDGIENYKAGQLENGLKYYVSVAILYPDQTESKRSEEIVAVCGLRKKIELSIRYNSEHDGYSLDKNKFVRADDDFNDLYYFSKNGKDYIASPARLDGFLRDSKFVTLDYNGEFQELKNNIAKYRKIATSKSVNVALSDWIRLETTDHKNALIKILGFSGTGKERKIKLFVAYSPIKNELIF